MAVKPIPKYVISVKTPWHVSPKNRKSYSVYQSELSIEEVFKKIVKYVDVLNNKRSGYEKRTGRVIPKVITVFHDPRLETFNMINKGLSVKKEKPEAVKPINPKLIEIWKKNKNINKLKEHNIPYQNED